MTFTQLEIFVAVVENKGFTSAAYRLGISQSGVSHAIASLETELDVTLIERGRAGLVLTEIGDRLLSHAREILALNELIRQEAAATKGLKRGTLRIGSFGLSASVRILPKLMQAFEQYYPEIEIHVIEGVDLDVIDWVHSRRVDIGFVVLPNDSLDTILLTEDELVALIPEKHPLAQAKILNPVDLISEPFILSTAGSGPLIEEMFKTAEVSPKIRYRIQQINSIINMVKEGLGVSVIARLALPENFTGVKVVLLESKITRSIGLGVRSLQELSPAARAFINLAQKMM